MKNLPNWDLTDLYPAIDCQEVKDDVERAQKLAENLSKDYKGNVVELEAQQLGELIAKYEEISEILGKLSTFSYLNYAADLSDPKNTSFYQDISEKISEISSNLVFFDIEINKISDKKFKEMLAESKELARYQPYLRDLRSLKKYQLSEELEQLFLEKSTTAKSAWSRLFDEITNNLKFNYRDQELNSSEIFNLLSSKDENIRKEAGKIIGSVLGDNSKILAYITNILAKDKQISDKWRKFKDPISSRNLSNFIEDDIVENLFDKVKENYGNISHRYYKFKAKLLGKDKLHYTDRNAPLPNSDEEKISWEEAKEIVLSAYGNFSPKIAEIGQKFFDNNWIDVPVRKGKDSGAFAHPCVPSVHPYLLLNYQGKVRDVMTLAHELGHGVHQFLSAKQGYLMASTPLTLSETASVFGEQLTFQEILRRQKDESKKQIIIANKVEDMINTVIRQIAFLDFEKRVHKNRQNGEIAISDLNKFWMDVQKESLGDIFEFGEEYKYYWSYIPHFIHSPFYVYSYAFGDCLVNSLYGAYQSGLDNFESKYIEMLKAGGTLHHKELLKPFGLDASKADFWQKGLDVIANYIDILENSLEESSIKKEKIQL